MPVSSRMLSPWPNAPSRGGSDRQRTEYLASKYSPAPERPSPPTSSRQPVVETPPRVRAVVGEVLVTSRLVALRAVAAATVAHQESSHQGWVPPARLCRLFPPAARRSSAQSPLEQYHVSIEAEVSHVHRRPRPSVPGHRVRLLEPEKEKR